MIKGESNGDPIPWITSQGNSRPRAPSKKEQYKRLWVELDTLLEAYQGNSVNHRFLYESFLDQVGKSNNNFKRGGTEKIEVMFKTLRPELTFILENGYVESQSCQNRNFSKSVTF